MHAGGGEAEDDVTLGDIVTRQDAVAFGGADREAGEVEVVAGIDAGHLGRLAADQRAARVLAAGGDAGDHGGAGLRRQPAAGIVVEEEQRLGALHDEVVHRHGDEVDADGLVAAGVDGDLDLGADAVGRRHQHRVLEAAALEVEQPAEAPDLGVCAGAGGGAHQRLDQVDHPVAGIDVDAGLRVGQSALVFRHGGPLLRGGRTSESQGVQWAGPGYILPCD